MDNQPIQTPITPPPVQSPPPSPQPPVPPFVPPPPQVKKSPKLLYLLLTLIFFSVASVFAYKYLKLKQQLTQPSPTPSATTIPTTDLTADWKTYTITSNNLTFEYPSDSSLIIFSKSKNYYNNLYKADEEYSVGYEGTDQFPIFIYLFKSTKLPIDWWNTEGKNTFEENAESWKINNPPININLTYETKNINISGKEAVKIIVYADNTTQSIPSKNNIIILQNNGYITMVTYEDFYMKIGNQILSTFKFIDQVKIPSSISSLFNKINQNIGESVSPILVSMDYFYSGGIYSTKKVWQVDLTQFDKDKTKMTQIINTIDQFQLKDSGGSGEGGGSYVYTYTNSDMDCTLASQNSIVKLSCATK